MLPITDLRSGLHELLIALFSVNLIELANQTKEGEDYGPIKRKKVGVAVDRRSQAKVLTVKKSVI